jgi:hypothetical protein
LGTGFFELYFQPLWECGSNRIPLKIEFLFLLKINFFMFLDRFEMLMLKMIFKK